VLSGNCTTPHYVSETTWLLTQCAQGGDFFSMCTLLYRALDWLDYLYLDDLIVSFDLQKKKLEAVAGELAKLVGEFVVKTFNECFQQHFDAIWQCSDAQRRVQLIAAVAKKHIFQLNERSCFLMRLAKYSTVSAASRKGLVRVPLQRAFQCLLAVLEQAQCPEFAGSTVAHYYGDCGSCTCSSPCRARRCRPLARGALTRRRCLARTWWVKRSMKCSAVTRACSTPSALCSSTS